MVKSSSYSIPDKRIGIMVKPVDSEMGKNNSAPDSISQIKVAADTLNPPLALQLGHTYNIKVIKVESGECDQCGELGPAQFEKDEKDPESPFPPLLYNSPEYLSKQRQKRPAVGMAQQLLNDFLIWMRIGGDYLTRGSSAKTREYLDTLPGLLKVDCWFGKNTETATKLFQEWTGHLKVDGKIGKQTWKELISFSDAYGVIYNKKYPDPQIPSGNPDLLAVPGLGMVDDSPIMLASADPSFLPDKDQSETTVRCARMYTKAANFSELVQLVRDAEILLQSAGVSDRNDRLRAIRGIYYGTLWSADYKKEKSLVRNTGFNLYASGTWGTVSQPIDPRSALACNLFEALQSSQDVTDGTRHVDFGHLIIGIESREYGQTGNIALTGHSGLEAATWLGDLGGGAAMISLARVTNPSTRARTRFAGTNFGGSINLEGDIAAYVTAMNTSITNRPASPVFPFASVTPVGDVVNDYLTPGTPSGGGLWQSRARNFLMMMCGRFTGNTLDNRSTIVDLIKVKIEEFGCYYLVNRLRQQGRLTSATMQAASEYMSGASQETAEIFVDALQHNVNHPDEKIRAVTDPPPGGKGTIPLRCNIGVQGTQVIETGREVLKKKLQEIYDILPDF
jgi:hypothetical protein